MSVKIGDTIVLTKAAVDGIAYIPEFKVGAPFKITSIADVGNKRYVLGFKHTYRGNLSVSSGKIPNWHWTEGVHFTVLKDRYPQRKRV